MSAPVTITIPSLSHMGEVAKILANILHPGDVIGLVGDLGSGKTTFVRLLYQALGGKDEVTSPTFVIEHIYDTPKFQVFHWDLYRLTGEIEDLGIVESSHNGVTLVEWPERFPGLKLDLTLKFGFVEDYFSSPDSQVRALSIGGAGRLRERLQAPLRKLEESWSDR